MGIAINKNDLIKKYFFSRGFVVLKLFCLQKLIAWYIYRLVMTN